MANQSISAHVAVISPGSGKLSESKANNQPDAASGADFAQILATQIQAPALPPSADQAALEATDKSAKDTQDAQDVKDTDIAALIADPQAAPPLPDVANGSQIAFLQSAQHVLQGQGCCDDKDEALKLAPNNVNAKTATPAIEANPDLEKAAKAIADPAKFAAADKFLPADTEHDIKTEGANPNAAAPANLAQANRAAGLPASTAPASLPAVEVPLGHAGWSDAFSQRVAWVATNTQQIAQLHLNPPNLGPLEIRISLNSDQANAAFTSPHAAVREAIEAALPRLRDMLADNGLSLGNVNVSSQSFQQQQQGTGQGSGQRHDPFQELQRIAASGATAGASVQAGVVSVLANKGLVDIFA
jgi:flagellar hook-length control protein FliK